MLLPVLAASFIYINTTAINSDQLLALEPTTDNKSCLVHLITKNPFQVNEPCTAIQSRVNAAKAADNQPDYVVTGIAAAIGALAGLLVGLLIGTRRR